MYNTGITGFLTAAASPNRQIDTQVTLTLQDTENVLTPDDIASYKITRASAAGKCFTPGNFVATPLELSLVAASPKVSKINFKTAVIRSISVMAGIKASQMVYVPMGVFYIEEDGISVGEDGYITIDATDIPPVLNDQFDTSMLEFPCTLETALGAISSRIGIDILWSSTDFPNFASVTLEQTAEVNCTYREALRYIAEIIGAYAQMGREGAVHFKKVAQGVVDIGCTLDDNYLYTVNQQGSTVKPFQYISIKANKDDIGVTQEVAGVTTGQEYHIINNPFTYGHPEDFLAGLVQPCSFTEFHPAKLVFHGRPDIDTGDVIQYTNKGGIYTMPVCIHTFEYNGGFQSTLEAIGTDSTTASSSKNQSDVIALRQSINSLVRDLEKTQSEIVDVNGDITQLSSLIQTAEQLQSQIAKLEGDMEQMSTLTQTANQLRIDIATVSQALKETNGVVNQHNETLLTYFDFQADGLTIGVNNSSIKLKLANDRIQFLKDGVEVAYLSEGKLYVTDAHFIKTLVLGNFEFTPRNNGNLSLRRR